MTGQAKVFSRLLGLLAALLAASIPSRIEAQDATIQGIITDQVSGQTLTGASVILEGASGVTIGAYTDRNGFYQIGGLAPGTYILRIQYVGYVLDQRTLTLQPGERPTISMGLDLNPLMIAGVTVTPVGGVAVRELGRQRITPDELRLVPMPAGSGDLANYLQTLPGVVTTGDRGGQLFIRGGTPAENMSLVDGMMIYQPFHIVGFFSAFPEDLISSVDFYAGGFGARYSGRTSSVLDVQMRDGNRSVESVTGSISPFIVEAVAEGPVDEGRISWMASARRSLIEETSSLVGADQPLTFDSQFLKVTSFNEAGSRCSATGMRTSDRGRMDADDPVSRVSWKNYVVGGRCTVLFERYLRLLEVSFSYSSATNAAVTRGASDLRSRISRLHHEAHATNLLGALPIQAGYRVSIETVQYDLSDLFLNQKRHTGVTDFGTYVEAAIPISGRAELRPGVVLSLMPTKGVDARLRGSWRPFGSESQEIQGALGMYRQDITGVSDQRDVGSVFTAWIEPTDGGPLKAMHAILGWQQQLGSGLSWSVEGYYKRLSEVPVPLWSATTDYTTSLNRADGTVRGADGRFEYSSPSLYGYIGYGYSMIEYESEQENFELWFGNPVQVYNPPHDRRHQLNALVSWNLGEVTAGARWQLGTGLPFTRPLGFDEAFDFRLFLEDVRELGDTRLLVDRPFQGRLPVTHRLDLSLKRSFELSLGSLEAQAGVINTYNRRNMFYYDLYTNRRVDQLPIVPYVSLRLQSR